jgi:hypothetical protein
VEKDDEEMESKLAPSILLLNNQNFKSKTWFPNSSFEIGYGCLTLSKFAG